MSAKKQRPAYRNTRIREGRAKNSEEADRNARWNVELEGESGLIYVEPHKRDRAFINPRAPLKGNLITVRIEIAENNTEGLLIEKGGAQCGWIRTQDESFQVLMQALHEGRDDVKLTGRIETVEPANEWIFGKYKEFQWMNKKRFYTTGRITWVLHRRVI